MHMHHVDARKVWYGSRFHTSWRHRDFDPPHCLSCGKIDTCHIARPFCSECREWSRQANLDEIYDDLRVGD